MQRLLPIKDELFLPYLAGYFDSRGSFTIRSNDVSMNFYGQKHFLEGIKSLFRNEKVFFDPHNQLKLENKKEIEEILDLLIPYLIIKKSKAVEVRKFIKTGVNIFNDSDNQEDIDFLYYTQFKWFYLYLIGYFDARSRWKIKNRGNLYNHRERENDYFLEITLLSEHLDPLMLLNELFDLGYVLNYNDKFKYVISFQDALDVLDKLEPFLINRRPELELAFKFREIIYSEKWDKIRTIIDEFNSIRTNSSKTRNLSVNVCKNLFDIIEAKTASLKISKSKLCHEAINYSYNNRESFKNVEDYCHDKKKDFLVAFSLKDEIEDKINILIDLSQDKNRSSIIRRALYFYLNLSDSEYSMDSLELDDIDPFEIIERLKK